MLLDHFNPPLRPSRQWNSFHSAWATTIAASLNEVLPEGYFAEPNVEFGIEVDVAALHEEAMLVGQVKSPAWTIPSPTSSIPLPMITDEVEVRLYSSQGLEGALELVSPANKDRPAHRDAFVSKCAGFVQRGIGLVIIDIVTERNANLHNELLERLRPPEWIAMESKLYACAYRPNERDGAPTLDYWLKPLSIGGELPTMPLGLKSGIAVPVQLAQTYQRTCELLRIPIAAESADLAES